MATARCTRCWPLLTQFPVRSAVLLCMYSIYSMQGMASIGWFIVCRRAGVGMGATLAVSLLGFGIEVQTRARQEWQLAAWAGNPADAVCDLDSSPAWAGRG